MPTAAAVVVLILAQLAGAQTPKEKELNDSVVRDREAFGRLQAEVGRGAVTRATLSALDGVVGFRDRWWGPGGIAATSAGMSLERPGGVREAYGLRAKAKLILGDHAGALADFAFVLTKDDPDEGKLSDSHFNDLFEHIERHRTSAERMADLDAVIRQAPRHGLLYMRRAQFKDYSDAAVADIETAMKLDTKNTAIYDAALDLYLQRGEKELAMTVLERATREIPLNFRFHRIRAEGLRGQQEDGSDTREGLQRLTRAINECRCQRTRLYYYYRERAAVHFHFKDYDAAIADADIAIAISEAMSGGKPATDLVDPDDWTYTTYPHYFRASSFIAKGMYKQALADLDVLVQASGLETDYAMRAEVRCKLGDVAGAKKDEEIAKTQVEIKNPCGSGAVSKP